MSAADVQRESMPVDVVIAGAGPAGLSAAIRLKQLDPNRAATVIDLREIKRANHSEEPPAQRE